jgi:hypothetical protein
MRAIATMVGLGLTLSVGIPQQALAQAPRRAAVTPDGVHHATRLGGSTRFTAPVRTVDAMKRTFTRMSIQNDVGRVLTEAGVGQLRAEVLRNITEGTVQPITVAPGTHIEWMALRRNGPRIMRNIEWNGPRPFRAFVFEIDDRQNPHLHRAEDCGNLSVLRTEPHRRT